MRVPTLRRLLLATLTLGLITGITAATGTGSRARVAGKITATYAQQQAFPVPNAGGHLLVLGQARGTNHSTGPTTYMAGSQVSNTEFADLVNGSGTNRGYMTFAKGADSTFTRWEGLVSTRLGPDNRPRTTFEGSWAKIGGTGAFAGITGGGDFKGSFTSQTDYVIEWQGEIKMK
jgi:hypothetical protein